MFVSSALLQFVNREIFSGSNITQVNLDLIVNLEVSEAEERAFERHFI